MANSKLPDKIVNADGSPTLEFIVAWDEVINGSGANGPSLGTLLSGVNQAQETTNGIIAGTTELVDVNIAGVGSLNAIQAVQDANINAATGAASSGALTATASRSSVAGTRVGAGSVTTASVIVTEMGGTAPYSHAWAYKSGDTRFAATAGSSGTTAFSTTVDLIIGEKRSAVWTDTVTDDLGATYSVDVGVAALENS